MPLVVAYQGDSLLSHSHTLITHTHTQHTLIVGEQQKTKYKIQLTHLFLLSFLFLFFFFFEFGVLMIVLFSFFSWVFKSWEVVGKSFCEVVFVFFWRAFFLLFLQQTKTMTTFHPHNFPVPLPTALFSFSPFLLSVFLQLFPPPVLFCYEVPRQFLECRLRVFW